jgi:flagellar biosynthetic protein FliQ
MNEADVLAVATESTIVMLKIGAPALVLALIVGLVISLFQALTQIQEMTLTFVPKMLVIFLSLLIFLPFMLGTLAEFTRELMERAAGG